MKLNNIKPAKGSTHKNKRIGRGEGSGRGGTSTRGTKGAQSRAGYSHKIGFEGGQMPLQRRVPKYGFKNPRRIEYQAVNVSSLQTLADKFGISAISVDTMIEAGLATRNDLVKVLGNGSLSLKLEVSAHAFSKTAVEKIEAAGGKVSIEE